MAAKENALPAQQAIEDNPDILPIERATMPSEDVSDLRDVVDAINRLCETMKTSGCDEVCETMETSGYDEVCETEKTSGYDEVCEDATEESWRREQALAVDEPLELVSPEEVAIAKVETHIAEQWSDTSPTNAIVSADVRTAVCSEPHSEMYYTASEVSLLSDIEAPDRAQEGDGVRDDRQGVIAGHVAAMRERFESMTRANTPCPELARSLSPSLDVFRNVTPSPDRLD